MGGNKLTKDQLQRQIRDIEMQEAKDKEKAQKEKNYKEFKNRGKDWVIGYAHMEHSFKDNGWHHGKGHLIPTCVSINGNCGTTYYPTASVTNSTNTYFHNVWKDEDRRLFQEKLNEVIQAEVERIGRTLPVVLEIMGLQSSGYFSRQYPEDKIQEVMLEVENAQKEVLDNYPDKDYTSLLHTQRWYSEDGSSREELETGLSHSNTILFNYIIKHRPSLIEKFSDVDRFKSFIKLTNREDTSN